MIAIPSIVVIGTIIIFSAVITMGLFLLFDEDDNKLFIPAWLIMILLITMLTLPFIPNQKSPATATKFLSSNQFKIKVISKDKAILFRDGDNEFSYIDITTKEDQSK